MVSVDRNALISQIVSLNPQLKPDELRKLSDAQLQTKLSQTLAGDNDDLFLGLQVEHSNSVVNLKNYNKKTYTDNNENEITEYLDNDNNILERTTKSTDENGNVTERTVTYQNHKPIHTSLKKNGNTIEKSDLTYKTSDDGTDYVEISTIGADKSETVSYVLLTDDNGSIYNDVLFGKAKTKLDGTTVHVSRNKGTLLEQINKPNGKSVLNIYNGNDFQAYDDNDLNKLYQRTDMNGSVREVIYDGNGNTYSTVNAGDSWAIIAQRYNVPENKLRALNKQKGALKPGQRILIPGEFNADSAPLKRTESPEVAKLKAENAERNRLLKIEQKQFEENFNSIIKNKTIPAANNLSSNITFGKKDKVSIEDFVKNVLHLDTSKEVGKKVLFRLAQLPQEALNKISYTDFEQKQIGGMFAPKTNDFSNASFDDIANALLVRAGINVKYNQEIIADNIKQKSVQSQKNKLGINEQKFSQEMLANIYDNAANMLEQYYNNHGIFDAGTYMEATKNILDKILPDNILGQDFRGTLHIASDCRKIAQRIRNLHSENPMQFKQEFAQLKKDGIVNTEFNEQNIKEFMNLVQSGNVDINSDKFKKACQKAFGFNGFENTENYTKLWSTAGNIGDIAIMLMTLGASARLKVMGKTTQTTFNMLEKGAAKIFSKSAAAKGAKLGTSMFMGGNTLAGYTLTKETLNNLSNPMRDAKDWDTWKQTGIASAESFGFGAFGGLLNETVVAPIVKAIEKPAAKATQAVTKAFAEQGELSGKEILQTALKGNEVNIDGFLGIFKLSSQEYATLARTATAKTVGFGTEVAGFTAYETALDTVKDIIDPKTGRLPEDMTLDNLTKYLEEKFGEQFANLGTIKSVSLFLMMSKGGKMAQKAMMTQMIASSEKLNNLKFKKAEINGQEFYEVTYPNGARKIVDMPEQAIALSQFALQMDMITATSEVKDTPQGMNVKVKSDGSTVVKDTPQGMLDVEEHELIKKASKEYPASRVEEKVREEWQKADLETSAPDEKVDLFNLDIDAGLKTSTPEIKNETTSLILHDKLNEHLTKRYEETDQIFKGIAQRRSADIQKLVDQYPNDKQKIAEGIVKILSEEVGMQGFEPSVLVTNFKGLDLSGAASPIKGKILINDEVSDLGSLTEIVSHEFIHMMQIRAIVIQYGEQGLRDYVERNTSIPENQKEAALKDMLENDYYKNLLEDHNAQKVAEGTVDFYKINVYRNEMAHPKTFGTEEEYLSQLTEIEAYGLGSHSLGGNTEGLYNVKFENSKSSIKFEDVKVLGSTLGGNKSLLALPDGAIIFIDEVTGNEVEVGTIGQTSMETVKRNIEQNNNNQDKGSAIIISDNTGKSINFGNIEEISIEPQVGVEIDSDILGGFFTSKGTKLQIKSSKEDIQVINDNGDVISLGSKKEVLASLALETTSSLKTSIKQRLRKKVAKYMLKTSLGRKVISGIHNAQKAIQIETKALESDKGNFYDEYMKYKDDDVARNSKAFKLYTNPKFQDLQERWYKHMERTGSNEKMLAEVKMKSNMSEAELIEYTRKTKKLDSNVSDQEVLRQARVEMIQEMIETAGVGPTKFAQIISNNEGTLDAIEKELSPEAKDAVLGTTSKCHPTRTKEEAQTYVDQAFGVNKYKVIKQMGTASMGETYLAERTDGSKCIMKMLKKGIDEEQLQLEEELYTMLIREFNDNPKSAESQIATMHQCYQDWADELYFDSELNANKQLAQGAQRYKVADATDLSPDKKVLVMDVAGGVQMNKLMEMLQFYTENPSSYSTKYAKEIKNYPWLAEPENILAKLPDVITKTFDEQFMFMKEGGKSLMHGDPHMGNYFINVDEKGNFVPEFIDTGLCIERDGETIKKDIKFFTDYAVGNSKGIAEYFLDQCDIGNLNREKLLNKIEYDIKNEIFNKQSNITNFLTVQSSINTILGRYNIALSPKGATAMKAQVQFFTAICQLNGLRGKSFELKTILKDIPKSLGKMIRYNVNPLKSLKGAIKYAFNNPESTVSTAYQFMVDAPTIKKKKTDNTDQMKE